MFQEYKNKISIKDILKVGDMVVGMHVDKTRLMYSTVVGKIIKTTVNNSGDIIYHILGDTLQNTFGEPVNFSGILDENEIEAIDPTTCNIIRSLYDLINKQVIAGVSYQETANKIRNLRQKSRQELEAKYPVGVMA